MRPFVAVEPFVEQALHERDRMEHQVLADQAAAVCETIGELRRFRVQQNARRADAVARHHDDFGALEAFLAGRVVVDDAVCEAVFVHRDLAYPTARAKLHAAANGLRPIRDVGARFAALRAAGETRSQVQALVASLIRLRNDRAVGWPPMPTEFVEAARDCFADESHRQRRQRRLLGRIHRIAGQARHPHHAVVSGEVRLQRVVVDRPIVGDTVERSHLEIGRMQSREMRAVQNRAAADAVEVDDRDRGVVVVDRIVRVATTHVRVDVIGAVRLALPIRRGARIVGRIRPIALLEADDAHARIRQAPRDRSARGACSDDQNVDDVVGHGTLPAMTEQCNSTHRCHRLDARDGNVRMNAPSMEADGSVKFSSSLAMT